MYPMRPEHTNRILVLKVEDEQGVVVWQGTIRAEDYVHPGNDRIELRGAWRQARRAVLEHLKRLGILSVA